MKETAIFAGGCFWCMIEPFDSWPGISKVISDYTGGDVLNPTYEEVLAGSTGHTEAIKIEFDASIISYEQLLTVYWQQTDPTDALGQFEDRGANYRPVIFFNGSEQQKAAKASKQALENSGQFNKPIVTQIEPVTAFYPAEEYHQNYYQKEPERFERAHQKRKEFIKSHWGVDK